jgi:hypothetical protein
VGTFVSRLAELVSWASGQGLPLGAPYDGEQLLARVVAHLLVPGSFTEGLAEAKPAMLMQSARREAASDLICAALKRLAEHQPSGCPTDCAEWRQAEEEISDAFWADDLDALRSVLEHHERLALARCHAWESETR